MVMEPRNGSTATISAILKELIDTYHELNSTEILELKEVPSPLEFMRHVSKNRPFVVREAAVEWAACKNWNADYLVQVMRDQLVNVAITPHGNADSVVQDDDGHLIFVKPCEVEEPFQKMLKLVQEQELKQSSGPVRYAQTQNDNLRNEYRHLFEDVPKDLPFARIALQREPEAINFWLGNSFSVTALHKDSYENLYIQVLGQKTFVLIPPVEHACVNEQSLPAATYRMRCSSPTNSNGIQGPDKDFKSECHETLIPVLDEPLQFIPFATWDPERSSIRSTAWSASARPVRVTLNPGDMLYLPALWYHKVSQTCSAEGLCCAVNYWYDMDFDGAFYPLCSFATKLAVFAEDCDKGKDGPAS